MKLILSLIFITCTYTFCFSQSADTMQREARYFRFAYDNDFFSATDRYYTQGTILSVVHPAISRSPINCILLRLRNSKQYQHGLHLEQDVFTPRSIRYMGGAIYVNERPYTATLYISQSLSSIANVKMLVLHSQFDIGILGPLAFGEETQKGIHKALDNIEPLGWQNQLSQDLILNYRAGVEKGMLIDRNFELLVTARGRVGTLYTDLTSGIHARFGILNPYFNCLGLQTTSYSRKKFTATLTVNANVRAVGYNATLQGGAINNKNIYELPDEDIQRLVSELYAGIVVGYKNLAVEYSRTYITKEFEGGVDHGWGRCAISVSF